MALAAFLVLPLESCVSREESVSKTQAAQQLDKSSIVGKIDSSAVTPITKEEYPKLYAAWGKSGFKRINDLLPLAAEKAALSPSCDKVSYVGVSERSVLKKEIIFFVDCENGERFYISELDLKPGSVVRTQSEKTATVTDSFAISLSESAVKQRLTYPTSFNRDPWSTIVRRHKETGNITVEFDFAAINSLGAKIPNHARCIISDDNRVEVSLVQ